MNHGDIRWAKNIAGVALVFKDVSFSCTFEIQDAGSKQKNTSFRINVWIQISEIEMWIHWGLVTSQRLKG
jgi:hypothetical protein